MIVVLIGIASLLVVTTASASGQQSRATLLVRIGALDGPAALGRIEAIEVDQTGRIYLLESDAHCVRVFSTEGKEVMTMGRQGAGPGEFRHPVGMALGPDGRLWVIDPGNGRASIYDLTGQHVGDKRVEAGFELAPWPGRFDRAGRLYHYSAEPSLGEFGYVMVQYDTTMAPRDTIVPPTPPEPPAYFETQTERWGTVRAAVPFAPRLIWHLGPDGQIWWAWTARYAVYRGANSRQPVIAREVEPVPVTDEDRTAALDALDRFRRLGGRVDVSRIPRTKPLLEGFVVDDTDRVWTLLNRGGPDRVLEVHDAHGVFLGRFHLPVAIRSTPQPVIRGNLVYGVVHDDLDVPYLVVLSVDL
jgi:6-bladed beta-propeller